jgi:pimeloyl-ACP methyl ester carboxylesterase
MDSPQVAADAVRETRLARFDSAGVPIHYSECGPPAGAPVLLMHGFLVDASLNWRPVIPVLAQHCRVIAVDARGHGRSGKPNSPGAYGAEIALDLVRLMDHLGIERAHVAGYSMGGLAALYLAAHHPDRLLSAVVCGAGLMDADDHASTERSGLGAALREAAATGENLGRVLARRAPPGMPAVIMGFYEALAAVECDAAALEVARLELPGLSVTAEQAAGISVPVFALMGDQDAFHVLARLKQALPSIGMCVLPGLGHVDAHQAPEFAQALLRHLMNVQR